MSNDLKTRKIKWIINLSSQIIQSLFYVKSVICIFYKNFIFYFDLRNGKQIFKQKNIYLKKTRFLFWDTQKDSEQKNKINLFLAEQNSKKLILHTMPVEISQITK